MPAATITSVPPDCATAAAFRLWGKAISDGIAARGWVKTADTGQVDWSTAAAPSGGTTPSYEVWRPGDSLQSTHPIFLRIEYGSATGLQPGLAFSLGTATDGAGTLSASASFPNTLLTRQMFTTSSSLAVVQSSTPGDIVVAGDESELVILAWWGEPTASRGYLLTCGRTRSWVDGAATTDGFYAHWVVGSNSIANRHYLFKTSPTQPGTDLRPALGYYSSGIEGTDVHVFPVLTGFTPKPQAPARYLVIVGMGDFTFKQSITVEHYGTNRTFRALSSSVTGVPWLCTSSSVLVTVAVRVD